MMGAQLVARVYTSWTHLPDRPFRLLAYMALITKDTNKVPTFWGGRDSLAESLGYRELNESVYRMVSRAINLLVAEGAIERAYVGHAGKRTEYRLTLEKGGLTSHAQGDSAVMLRVTPESGKGDSTVRKGGTQQSPLGTIRKKAGALEEPKLVTDVSVPAQMRRIAKARNSNLDSARARTDAGAAS